MNIQPHPAQSSFSAASPAQDLTLPHDYRPPSHDGLVESWNGIAPLLGEQQLLPQALTLPHDYRPPSHDGLVQSWKGIAPLLAATPGVPKRTRPQAAEPAKPASSSKASICPEQNEPASKRIKTTPLPPHPPLPPSNLQKLIEKVGSPFLQATLRNLEQLRKNNPPPSERG